MSQYCCGTALAVIRLSADEPGRAGIELHRCARCGSRGYVRGDVVLRPAEAFAALAGTFQQPAVPAPARRNGASSGPRAAELAEQRRARAEQRAQAAVQAAAQARPAGLATQTPAGARVDVTDLADLLGSWTVLGASR